MLDTPHKAGGQILSDIVSHIKYAQYLREDTRRETWAETTERGKWFFIRRFPHLKEKIEEAFDGYVLHKKVLPSMRFVQYAGKALERHPSRVYNCAYLAMDELHSFRESLLNLLLGTGVGFSIQRMHTNKLPTLKGPISTQTLTHVVEDSVEGWADAYQALVSSYLMNTPTLDFDYSKIRPEGSPLITSGGRAPGPEPLRKALDAVREVLETALARVRFGIITEKSGACAVDASEMRLLPIEIFDILCHGSECVSAGGSRRSAMIALFDAAEQDMLRAKAAAAWRAGNIQRSKANITAVHYLQRTTYEQFKHTWNYVVDNNTGEPGILWSYSPLYGLNPCAEIALLSRQFCNLSTINTLWIRSQRALNKAARIAAFLGTLQASLNHFDYLDPLWSVNSVKDALLGVSLSGIAAGTLNGLSLSEAAGCALDENKETARQIGINPAARVTTMKPDGNSGALLGGQYGCSSGVHDYEAQYYLRRVEIGVNEPIHDYLMQTVPHAMMKKEGYEDTLSLFTVPIQAPPTASSKPDNTAFGLFERVLKMNREWVRAGHRYGENHHNVSSTISVREDEWEELGEAMWRHRHDYHAVSTLPFWGGTHPQLPFQPTDKETHDELLRGLQGINLHDIVETSDRTAFSSHAACTGPICDI